MGNELGLDNEIEQESPRLRQPPRNYEVRKAQAGDIPAISRLVNKHAELGEMLPRDEDELYEALRDFFVASTPRGIVGCGALHIMGRDLAEVRSLAVDSSAQGMGLGRAIVSACVQEAREIGVTRVFALTTVPDFFYKLGFYKVSRNSFPQKIWKDCFKCKFFENCIEVAVQYDIGLHPGG